MSSELSSRRSASAERMHAPATGNDVGSRSRDSARYAVTIPYCRLRALAVVCPWHGKRFTAALSAKHPFIGPALSDISENIMAEPLTSNPQRYDLVPITRGMETWEEMRKADDGDWIRFEDYERLTATLLIQERIAQANLRLFAEAQAERDRLRAALECAYGIWSRFQGEHCTAADEMADVINAALNIGQEIGHAQRTADEHTQSRISENHTGSRIAQPDETDAPLLEKVRARIDSLTEGVEIGDLNDLLPPDEPQ